MEKTKTDISEGILYRYLKGETTPGQEKEIFEWLLVSEENRRYFFDLKAVWNAHGIFRHDRTLNRYASMITRLNTHIDSDRKRAVATPRRRLVGRILAATAVAAAVALAVMVWSRVQDPMENRMAYSNPGEEVLRITLEDGSRAWLGSDSRLDYARNRKTGERTVALEGEAFFDVARGPGAESFIVSTGNFGVEVLGTAFNVKAYPGAACSEVVLERGSVRLLSAGGDNLIRLRPNQKAVFDNLKDDVEVVEIDAASFMLMKYNLITMSGATVDQILTNVESIYGVKIRMAGRESPKKYDFNFLHTNTLNQVIDIIEYMTGNKCEIVGKE